MDPTIDPEEPSDTIDDPQYSLNGDDAVALTDVGIEFKYTVDGEDSTDAALAGYVKVENVTDDKVSTEDDVTVTFNIPDDVELVPATTNPVMAVIDSGSGTAATESDGVYTIAGSKSATSGVVVTIAFETKTYSVSAPANTDDVTWKIKLADGDTYGTNAVSVKKGGSVKLEATKKGADDVEITVAGATPEKATLTGAVDSETAKAEFTIVMDADRLAAIEKTENKLTAAYDVKKPAAEVVITGVKPSGDSTAAAVYGTDFTAQYRVKTGTDEAGDVYGEWTAVAAGKIAAKKDDEIQIKITPVGKFSVSAVTFDGTAKSATEVEGEDVYAIKVAAPANPVATENTIAVTLAAANKVTLKGAADAQIASVKWSTDDGSTWKNTRKTADGWAADTDSATVCFQIAAKTNYKVVKVAKGTEDLTLDPAAGGKTVKTPAVDASAADVELTITTERIKVDYTLTASTGLTVTIKDSKGTAVTKKQTQTTNDDETPAVNPANGTYELLDGETYSVEVKEGENPVDLAKLGTATAGGTTMGYDGDAEAFTFVAAEDAATKAIAITLKEKEDKTVSVVMADAGLTAASIKADAHKAVSGDVAADAESAVLTTTATDKQYTVLEGTDLTFTLTVADEAYLVSKVETSMDSTTWTELTATEGKYTLKAVGANTTVRVTTALDTTKAYSITFKADENVKAVTMDLAGGANPAADVTLDEANYLKAAAGASVTFKVETYSGFTVDKVAFGTGESDTLTANGSGVYTYGGDKFSATNKTATINISTKKNALSADRYVKFTLPESNDENADKVELNVTTEGVKTEKDGEDTVYVLTKEVKEGENVTTPEVPELAFDLVVENGYTIQPQLATITATDSVRATLASRKKGEDGRWVYSFKVVGAAIDTTSEKGTAKDDPKVITVGAPTEEKVSLSLGTGSAIVQYKNLNAESSDFSSWSSGTKPVSDKDTIVLNAAGMSLTVGGKDVTKDMDEEGNYSFVAALDPAKDNDTTIEVKATAAEAAEYELLYGIGEDAVTTPVGKDAVEAKLGDKITVQLNTIAQPSNKAEAITAVVKSETAKNSTAVADANQTANKGKAVITVGDADFTVTFKATKSETLSNGITKKTVVNAATIHVVAKDANGTTLTAKGVSNNKTVKIDATKKVSYPLTLKSGKTTLDVKKYIEDGALIAASDKEALVKAAFDTNGNLVISALKDKDGEAKAVAEISIKAKGAAADAAPLLKFKVEVQTPKLAVKSLDSPNQGMQDLLVNVAADTKIGTVATADFDMYYEVVVKHTEGSSASKKDGTYYFGALDGNGNIVPVSQLIKVNGDTAEKCENKYTVTARIVAVAAGTSVTAGSPAVGTSGTPIPDASVKYASAAKMEKTFSTRPGNYEEKLGVTKKTTKLYSGQNDVLVAVPKFSAKAGHIDDINAVVYNTDGSLAAGMTAYVDNTDTMGVYVSAGEYAATVKSAAKYNVVIYATATSNQKADPGDPTVYNMYRASAKVAITVQKSIDDITVAGAPGKIALVADNKGKTKDVSFTLKPTGWYYGSYYNEQNEYYYSKAQTQKFTYDVNNFANTKNAGKVTVKNGKVTVSKDFYVSNDPAKNKFTLSVKANDWTGNTAASDPIIVEVTNKAMEISSVRLVREGNGKPYGATIAANDLYARVEVLDENGKVIDPSCVTLTPNKGKMYVDEDGILWTNGYQKNLTIKAVAKDGKKANKSSIKYTIEYPKVSAYMLGNVAVYDNALTPRLNQSLKQKEGIIEYAGRGSEQIRFNVWAVMDDWRDEDFTYTSRYNYSVKIAGGKNTSSKASQEHGYYNITPTGDKVTVTITDKQSKPAKNYKLTFVDTRWQKDAAPKASTKDKLFVAQYAAGDEDGSWDEGDVIPQTMTYTIKNCKYSYVKFTQVGGSYYGIANVEGVHPIAADTLTLTDLVPSAATTEKYSVVYGDKVDGYFVPKTKAASISIKVNKVGNIKAVNKYTISTNLGYGVKLDAKPLPGSVSLDKVVSFDSIEAANVKGQPNQFYEYFELVNGNTIQIKTKYQNEAGLIAIRALDKSNLNGYLTYTVYNANGNQVQKQDKITLAVNDSGKPKTTTTDINIVGVNAASAFTSVKIGNNLVDVAKVITDSADWNVAAATAAEMEAGNGNVKLTAKAAPVAGNVNLYILPVGSSYPTSTADDVIKEKGIKATVKVNVKAADDAKSSKITFQSKNAKTPVASIVDKKVNLITTFVLGTDYKYSLSNTAVASVEKVPEAKQADVKNAASKTAMGAITTVSLNAAKDEITIVMDRDAQGLDQKGKTAYQVPVFVKFTAGAEEIVYFPIKPKAVPNVESVKTAVEKELNNLPVTAYNGANGNAAADEVQTAARALGTSVVDPLSGVDVAKITAAAKTVEGQKFADEGTKGQENFKEGHHTVVVTLDDETKKGSEGYAAATLDVKVTEKKAPVTLGQSLENAVNKWLLPNQTTGADPTGATAVPTTMTKLTMQTALQDAADAAAPGKYVIEVTTFTLVTENITVSASAGGNAVNADEGTKKTITKSLTFKYTIKNANSGKYMQADGSEVEVDFEEDEEPHEFVVTMGTTSNTVATPEAPSPVTPPATTSYNVTITGENVTVKSADAAADSDEVPTTFTAVTNGTVSVESGKKLYLEVTAEDGYTLESVKRGNDTVEAVTGHANVYLIGTIDDAATTVTITAKETTPSNPQD